jgi:hypothetical protein
MRHVLYHRRSQRRITGLLLVALAFRALIPAGFMPSAERPLTLEICHAGSLMALDAQHPVPHPAGSSHLEHCPFGAAPSLAVLPHLSTPLPAGSSHSPSAAALEPLRYLARLERAHPARGPPRLA